MLRAVRHTKPPDPKPLNPKSQTPNYTLNPMQPRKPRSSTEDPPQTQDATLEDVSDRCLVAAERTKVPRLVLDLGFRVSGFGLSFLSVQGLGFKTWGFRGSGFGVEGFKAYE